MLALQVKHTQAQHEACNYLCEEIQQKQQLKSLNKLLRTDTIQQLENLFSNS